MNASPLTRAVCVAALALATLASTGAGAADAGPGALATGSAPTPLRGTDALLANWRRGLGLPRPSSTPALAALAQRARRLAIAAGASRATATTYISVTGRALELDVSTPRPAHTLLSFRALVRLLALDAHLAAYAVRLRDRTGATVWEWGHDGHSGFVGARADLDACSPVGHLQITGGPHPPCPARR